MRMRCFSCAAFAVGIGVASPALALNSLGFLLDESPAVRAAQFRQNMAGWVDVHAGLLEGSYQNVGQTQTTDEKRFTQLVRLGADVPTLERMALRAQLVGVQRRARRVDAGVSTIDETRVTYLPSLTWTIVTPTQLEVFFGLQAQIRPGFSEETQLTGPDSTRTFDSARLIYPWFGFAKRGASWYTVFYYLQGEEAERAIVVSVENQDTQRFSDILYKPSEAGLRIGLSLFTVDTFFEFTSIFAGEGGPITDTQELKNEDFLRLRLGLSRDLGGLRLGLDTSYTTQRYADNNFIDLDNIPYLQVESFLRFGPSPESFWGLSLRYLSGQDRQSLPQFNADLKLQALSVGLTSRFLF